MKDKVCAVEKILLAWPEIVEECRSVLGSELHYQAMVYHCLRTSGGVPLKQVGMNVKMRIENPVSELFKSLDRRKHSDFRGGFEPIPDVVLFSDSVSSDWRRRNRTQTLTSMLAAIEVKASERLKGRLRKAEVVLDIEKLAALRQEALSKGTDFFPVMMVIDTAPIRVERMTSSSLDVSMERARQLDVGFLYLSPDSVVNTISA